MAKRKKSSVLKISPQPKRRTVVINGLSLEMLNTEEIKIDAAVRLRHVLDDFKSRDKMTEERAMMLAMRLKQTVRDILPSIPKEIDDKLSDSNRIDIMIAFFKDKDQAPAAMASAKPIDNSVMKATLAGMGIGVA